MRLASFFTLLGLTSACAQQNAPTDVTSPVAHASGAVTDHCIPPEADILVIVEASSRMGALPPSNVCDYQGAVCKSDLSRWANTAIDARAVLKEVLKTPADVGVMVFPEQGWDRTPKHKNTPTACDVRQSGDFFEKRCVQQTTLKEADSCMAHPPVVHPDEGFNALTATRLWNPKRVPTGKAGLESALTEAFAWFENRPSVGRARHVILITDGVDECAGDASEVIRRLRSIGVDTWVSGFDGPNREALNALARRGGRARGQIQDFYPAREGLAPVLKDVLSATSGEVCDGYDNDCDGLIDEKLVRACDASCGGQQVCLDGRWRGCAPKGDPESDPVLQHALWTEAHNDEKSEDQLDPDDTICELIDAARLQRRVDIVLAPDDSLMQEPGGLANALDAQLQLLSSAHVDFKLMVLGHRPHSDSSYQNAVLNDQRIEWLSDMMQTTTKLALYTSLDPTVDYDMDGLVRLWKRMDLVQPFLRADSVRHFVTLTDGDSVMAPEDFDQQVRNSASMRRYRFHGLWGKDGCITRPARLLSLSDWTGGMLEDRCTGGEKRLAYRISRSAWRKVRALHLSQPPKPGSVSVRIDGVDAIEGRDWLFERRRERVILRAQPTYRNAVIELCYSPRRLEDLLGGRGGVSMVESCDDLDNNCDGDSDEPFVVAQPCEVRVGECVAYGYTTCHGDQAGASCAVDPPDVTDELCDGRDNDCDGVTDEDLNTSCSDGCRTGTRTCDQGNWSQCDLPPLEAEVCDGRDNDCDGVIDNDFGVGNACTNTLEGCVAEGVLVCDNSGTARCSAETPQPSPEICDNRDNDCDGLVDENTEGMCELASQICFAGQCIYD